MPVKNTDIKNGHKVDLGFRFRVEGRKGKVSERIEGKWLCVFG
jgi:hypothetical protein